MIIFSDNGTINAFNNHSTTSTLMTASSPTHSPNCPPGAIDIELEVGDHEVDTMFRDPGTKPIILARSTPPLQVLIFSEVPKMFLDSFACLLSCFVAGLGRSF